MEPSAAPEDEPHGFRSSGGLTLKVEAEPGSSEGGTVHFPSSVPSERPPDVGIANLPPKAISSSEPAFTHNWESSVTRPCLSPLPVTLRLILSPPCPESHPPIPPPFTPLPPPCSEGPAEHDFCGLLPPSHHLPMLASTRLLRERFPPITRAFFLHSLIQHIFSRAFCVPGTVLSGDSLVIKISEGAPGGSVG